jgi:hypothetical protein
MYSVSNFLASYLSTSKTLRILYPSGKVSFTLMVCHYQKSSIAGKTLNIVLEDSVKEYKLAFSTNSEAKQALVLLKQAIDTLKSNCNTVSVPTPTDMALDDLTDVVITSPHSGQHLVFDGTNWVNQDAASSTIIQQGTGVVVTGNGNTGTPYIIGLDLNSKTLVSPVISNTWSVYMNNGTTLITTSNASNITVEQGSQVGFSGTYQYPIPNSTQAGPTLVSGTWGTTLYPAGTSSAVFNNGGVKYTSNSSLSQTLAKPKSGLIVVGSQVQVASGNDTTSASVSVSFLYASYFGYSLFSTLSASDIKALGNKQLQSNRGRTLSGVSAGSVQYTYYCYPSVFGALDNIIQNGALPILGAFTRLSDVTITNDAGLSVSMAVYKSNATNAFTNATLVFS